VLLYRHELGNKLLTTFSNLVTNLNLSDMETCYKAVRTPLLKSIPLESNDFRIEPELNRVVIGDDPMKSRFTVRDHNWIAVEKLAEPIRCNVQIRNRFEPKPATVSLVDGQVTVEFDEPQRAITPGQGAVFYWDDVVVGGGWIAA